MSGGYRHASSRVGRIATDHKKPLFYDYSEEFEDVVEPPPLDPIAPIPQRVSTAFRPVNFHNNSVDGLESMEDAQNEFEAYLQEGTNTIHLDGVAIASIAAQSQPTSLSPRETDLLLQRPVHDNPDAHSSLSLAAPPLNCPEPTSVLNEGVPVENTSDVKDTDQTKKSTIGEIISDSSTLDDPPEPNTPAFTAGIPFLKTASPKEEIDPCRVSHDGHATCQDVVLPHGHDILPATSKSISTNLCMPHTPDADNLTLPKVSCHPRHGSRLYSAGSGLSDWASFFQQVDQHFQTLGTEDPKTICCGSQGSHPQAQDSEAAAQVKHTPCLGEVKGPEPEKPTTAVSHPPRMSSLRGTRAQPIPLRVNTAVGEPHQYQVVSTRNGPTLTPQPISPAKLLRVKNSIPQLMKALPPLPGYAPAPESPFGPAVVPMEFEPFEISQLTDARSTLIDAVQGGEAPKGYDAFIFDKTAHKPRLKLKHAASFAVERDRSFRRECDIPKSASRPDAPTKRPTTSTGNSAASAGVTEYSSAPVKRRLPIKISRPALASLVLDDDTGTVKRRTGMQKSSTVSEFASREPIDLFSSAAALKAAVASHETSSAQPAYHASDRAQEDMPLIKITPVARIRQIPVDADTRGTSLDTQMDMMRASSVESQPGVMGEIQSFFSDNSIVKPHQGLRKRISNLRLKLAESRNHHKSPLNKLPRDDRLEDDHRDSTNIPLAADGQPTRTYKEHFASTDASKADRATTDKRKFRSKLEKFMKGAKHRLRTWGAPKRRVD
jgi:hypothetical protein